MNFIDYDSFEKAVHKSIGITFGLIAASFVTGICISSCANKNNDSITWDDIKGSYVGLVHVDGEYTTNLLKDNNNGLYEDIINNTIINKNENIKNSYTKEELKEIIKKFKIGSNEYTYSDDYVLMK